MRRLFLLMAAALFVMGSCDKEDINVTESESTEGTENTEDTTENTTENTEDTTEGTEWVDGGYIISTSIYFTVQDTEGNDLLNSNTPGYIKQSGIKTSYLDIESGDIEIEKYRHGLIGPRIEYPGFGDLNFFSKGLLPIDDCIKYNSDGTEAYAICYIQWDENTVDTLECTFKINGGYFGINEIVINDQLRWYRNIFSDGIFADNSNPYFKIVVDGDQRTISLINPTEYLHKTE